MREHPKTFLSHFCERLRATRVARGIKCLTSQRNSCQRIFTSGLQRLSAINRVASFDLVLIDGLALQRVASSEFIKNELRAAKAILLDDLSGPFNFENYDELTKDSTLVLTAHNPDLRNGYSIFRRKSASSPVFETLCTASLAAK